MSFSRIFVYWRIAQMSFQEYLVYRGNVMIEVAGRLLTSFLAVGLWYAIFQLSNEQHIAGYTLSHMITYLLGVGIIEGVVHIAKQSDKQADDITRGTMNQYLVKPFSPFGYWCASDLARKAMMVLFMCVISVVIGVVFWQYIVLPPNGIAILEFFVLLLFAAVLHFLLFSLIALSTFWWGVSWGLSFVFRVLMGIATGGLAPLELFPAQLRDWLLWSPFAFFGHVPMQAFLGRMTTEGFITALLVMFAWIVVCGVLWKIFYTRGVRVYGAYGG